MTVGTYLRNRGIPFVTILHRPAPSAARVAQSVHVAGRCVAKSVLLRTERWYVLAVLPATHRVDLAMLEEAMGGAPVQLASEDEVERLFLDCERGARPPFGALYGVTTLVDESLACDGEIVVEGNTRHEGIRLRYRDYEIASGAARARFASEIEPARQRIARHAS